MHVEPILCRRLPLIRVLSERKITMKILNRHKIMSFFLVPILLLLSSGCTPTDVKATRLTVAAAISLSDALAELKQEFIKTNPELDVQFNYGASGVLEQQIEHGSPVDLFISAGEQQMTQSLVFEDSVKPLVGNSVVLITPANAATTVHGFEDLLPKAKKIALGNPKTVPAGQYGKQVLEYYHIYDKLQGKLVLAEDVRQALTMVATGNAEAGLVYQTDALSNKGVKIIAVAPPASHAPVVYPIAVVKRSAHADAARKFEDFALSTLGQKILANYGFTTP